MGRLRGKRNRDQDRYWTIQRRAEQAGMVHARLAMVCVKCESLVAATIYKGWCEACVLKWAESSDPWLLMQSRDNLPQVAVSPTLAKEVNLLQERIIRPIPDELFLPLTQFMGNRTISDMRGMWNFLQALYSFQVPTTAAAFQIGHNTLHLCGRHAPVQRMSISAILSRIQSARDVFTLHLEDKLFLDYLKGFISDNKIFIYDLRRTDVDVFARFRNLKVFGVASTKGHFDKYCPTNWPFQSEVAPQPMPDIVIEIGELVPAKIPATLREDLCQDLAVAILSGETTIEQLRGSLAMYIQAAFKNHPLRYGRFSLDQPPSWYDKDDKRFLRNRLTDEDLPIDQPTEYGWPIEPLNEVTGWHHGKDRPLGIASLGELSADKHGGYAIAGGMNPKGSDTEMDPDIQEVFNEEQHPRWRRKFSG